MAEQSRKIKRPAKGRKSPRYFFLNGLLHKVLFISRPQDLVWCWSYSEAKRVQYAWSYVKKHYKRAYSTREVAAMVNRDPRTISNYWAKRDIRVPQHTYGLTSTRRTHAYKWDEKDIMELHEYLLTVNIGRPRADGLPRIKPMPTKAELLALIRHDMISYFKDADGEFKPMWKEPEW